MLPAVRVRGGASALPPVAGVDTGGYYIPAVCIYSPVNSFSFRTSMPERLALQDDLRQKSPFRNTAEEATLSIVRTATLIRRAVAGVVEQAGISPAQYNVLRILRGAGQGGLPTLTVRDRLIDEAPGITRLLDRLEAAELVRRERSTPDRRQVMCVITAQGLALLKKLDVVISNADETGGAGLTDKEQVQLVTLLEKVRASMPRPSAKAGTPPTK